MSTFTAIKSMLWNQNWRLILKTFNYWYICRSVADSVCSWCRGPLRVKLPKFVQKLCLFLSINWLTYELIHKERSFWDWTDKGKVYVSYFDGFSHVSWISYGKKFHIFWAKSYKKITVISVKLRLALSVKQYPWTFDFWWS